MSRVVESVCEEFRRYKALAERAIAQLPDERLSAAGPNGGNSVAVLVWHISGNLASRFTDFLTTDGEKPWRGREEEFAARSVTRTELLEKWEKGWSIVLDTLDGLTDAELHATITIRQQPMHVHEALLRSVTHTASHVGQIVYLAKAMQGETWEWLSIPPGGSDANNKAPTMERASDHAGRPGGG
jgi:uncharacterized damage-inducible protein DinB